MQTRFNLLVVCAKNKKRSRTAEFIFKNDSRFAIRSAGLSKTSNRVISGQDIEWANLILVMEHAHNKRLKTSYGHLDFPPVHVLKIKDIYEFNDPELIDILKDKVKKAISSLVTAQG